MSKIFIKITIFFVKVYKSFFSPILGNRCRFLPSCSDYFIECLNEFGLLKGFLFGIKRISNSHPIKFLGGRSGLDLNPKKRKVKNAL